MPSAPLGSNVRLHLKMTQDGTPPLLIATGQHRRLRFGGYAFFAGFILIYAARTDVIEQLHPFALFVVAAAGTLLATIGALLAIYTIRCPKCGLPWLRWSLGHRPAGDWLHWLYRFEECPQCKHRAT